MNHKKVSGIILAGGKSRRMGTEKGLVNFHGRKMIEYALDALNPHCSQILISANTSAYDFMGHPVIHDEVKDAGPLAGILSCLKKSDNEINFVLSCDTPLIDHEVVGKILAELEGFEIVVPCHENGFIEPLCAVYHKSIVPAIESNIANQKFKILDLIQQVKFRKIETSHHGGLNPDLFFNVNSKDDLNQARIFSGIQNLPNLLMIAGTGRKVGKTSFACLMIESKCREGEVVGIKISPHMHEQAPGQKVIGQSTNYLIIEETDAATDKDSSRMLRAGASRVYYLQTADRHIEEPFSILLDLIPSGQAVVCESGALLNYAKPGLFLLIKRKGQTAFKKGLDELPYKPDQWVVFDGDGFDKDVQEFQFSASGWK